MNAIAKFVQHVLAQLGESEHPLGSNHQRYGEQFGWDDVSWCAEFGYDMYDDVGVQLPVKSAACVVVWDESVKAGLTYPSTNCVAGDSVIRTWQHLPRAKLNPAETHYQIVVGTHVDSGRMILELVGGNQGPGVVSRDYIPAGDPSVLGGLAFHKLIGGDQQHQQPATHHDPRSDAHQLPATKSHKYPAATLSLGSHGPLVGELQHRLQHLGFYRDGKIDNSFGPATLAAVLAFQKHAFPNQPQEWDGAVGPKTYRAVGF